MVEPFWNKVLEFLERPLLICVFGEIKQKPPTLKANLVLIIGTASAVILSHWKSPTKSGKS